MRPPEHRTSIERKILTAILWVGILPMTVAMIISYLTARSGQTTAVQETLLTAAEMTATGIDEGANIRFTIVNHLAEEPRVKAYIAENMDATGAPGDAGPAISEWLAEKQRILGDDSVNFGIYDASGRLRVASAPADLRDRLGPEQIAGLSAAEFRAFSGDDETGQYFALIVAPVRGVDNQAPTGYVAMRFGINALISFGLGRNTDSPQEGGEVNFYQMAYAGPRANGFVVWLERDPDTGQFQINESPGEQTHTAINFNRAADVRIVRDYRSSLLQGPNDVLLAYQQLKALPGVHIIVYRPAAMVYSRINTMATLALGGWILFTGGLCLISYRDVHNNIVRPVSLLNEGAQIIRQGDYDLKLKIGTGDEIEELALSFNKMALALKQNIQQLEESEEKYRSLVTSMRDGIFQTDLAGQITFLNPAGVEILGFPAEKRATGANMRELFLKPDIFDTLLQSPESPARGERPRIWMRRWDGPTICVELTASRDYDDNGEPIGIEGVFRDITRNVRLEREARERSERIAAINKIANVINSNLEAGLLYESLVGELHKLISFDYAAVALRDGNNGAFGVRQLWPDEESHVDYTFKLDAETSYAGWVERDQRCLVVEDLQDGHSPFAAQFPASIRSCLCVPLRATGRIIGSLALGHSNPAAYTDRMVEVVEHMAPHLAVAIRNAQLLLNLQNSLEEVTRAREKLHEVNEELKTLDEMKTNLLSNVSHELRTPLVSVMGYTDMILNGKAGPINKTQQDYLEISLRNVEKLVTLIENLLDFSKLHRGDERLVFATFDLVECARTSMQVIQPVADSRGIVLELYTDMDQILVEGDKGKLGQVFNNLLSNAVKFNKPGGSVMIDLNAIADAVEVSVTDTGIGIPEEALDKVFTRFYQYDASSTRKYGGTGIGLSIAQDIVRLHGGTISASSVEGDGTTFRFKLQLSQERKPAAFKEPPVIPPSAETHLLLELVTNDASIAVQMREFVMSEGMDVLHAATPDKALALARRHSPDCILADLNAPYIDDLLLTQLAEVSDPPRPIILLTNDDKQYASLRDHVTARVKRSFRKSSLLSGIHHALSKSVKPERPAGEKILCIDDDAEILRFMRRCLEAEGYTVELATSGDEGLRTLEETGFALVLLDIAMPGIDGWETCRRIKSTAALSQVKVYLVTAKPIDRSMARMRECMADGILLKPFRSEDLIQLVRGLEIPAMAK